MLFREEFGNYVFLFQGIEIQQFNDNVIVI